MDHRHVDMSHVFLKRAAVGKSKNISSTSQETAAYAIKEYQLSSRTRLQERSRQRCLNANHAAHRSQFLQVSIVPAVSIAFETEARALGSAYVLLRHDTVMIR